MHLIPRDAMVLRMAQPMSGQDGSALRDRIDQRGGDSLPFSRSEVISDFAQNQQIEILSRSSFGQRRTTNFHMWQTRAPRLGHGARRGRKINCVHFVAAGRETLGEHTDGATWLKRPGITSVSDRADDRIVPS